MLQSLNEAHIPNALLERLVTNSKEFPPVCAIIGGILGQVRLLVGSLETYELHQLFTSIIPILRK